MPWDTRKKIENGTKKLYIGVFVCLEEILASLWVHTPHTIVLTHTSAGTPTLGAY